MDRIFDGFVEKEHGNVEKKREEERESSRHKYNWSDVSIAHKQWNNQVEPESSEKRIKKNQSQEESESSEKIINQIESSKNQVENRIK